MDGRKMFGEYIYSFFYFSPEHTHTHSVLHLGIYSSFTPHLAPPLPRAGMGGDGYSVFINGPSTRPNKYTELMNLAFYYILMFSMYLGYVFSTTTPLLSRPPPLLRVSK